MSLTEYGTKEIRNMNLSQKALVWVPALPLLSWVTVDKSFYSFSLGSSPIT